MDTLALLPEFLSPETFLAFGLVGLMITVFAETGLLVGFFLPGDSLLFLAGVFAASGQEGSRCGRRPAAARGQPVRLISRPVRHAAKIVRRSTSNVLGVPDGDLRMTR